MTAPVPSHARSGHGGAGGHGHGDRDARLAEGGIVHGGGNARKFRKSIASRRKNVRFMTCRRRKCFLRSFFLRMAVRGCMFTPVLEFEVRYTDKRHHPSSQLVLRHALPVPIASHHCIIDSELLVNRHVGAIRRTKPPVSRRKRRHFIHTSHRYNANGADFSA